ADQALYEEFKNHYAQMGEKSFDHTKKFWFNALRKKYHLDAPPIAKAESKIAPSVVSDSAKAATTAAPSGFKPRFKAGGPTPVPVDRGIETDKAEQGEEQPAASKLAGFKPRFKTGATNS